MLNRFFKLGEGTGGPQASAITQTIVLDAELDRALGFYRTTAYNVDMALTLKGTDMQKATLQAAFGNERSLSVATNQTPDGRTMSVAFNDLGTLLRFVGVYPNLEGGAGTLVMRYDNEQKADFGTFALRELRDRRRGERREHRRQPPRVPGDDRGQQQARVPQRARSSSSAARTASRSPTAWWPATRSGGTLKGFIYTDAGQYDLTGTYVPLFGFSRAIQKRAADRPADRRATRVTACSA